MEIKNKKKKKVTRKEKGGREEGVVTLSPPL
jgi:hypothetical protein